MAPFARESGSPAAPAIVFLHGGGISSKMWQPQLDLLRDFHCLAPDMPEHGHSASQPFEIEDATRQVAALIRERVSSGRAHVVGLSLGGAVILNLLRIAPECVDHAVVSGTSSGIGQVLGSVGIASAYLVKLMPAQTLVNTSIKQFGIPAQYVDLVRDDLALATSVEFNKHIMRALMSLELPQKAEHLLVAVGEKETPAARQQARQLVTRINGARGVAVPNVGHVWNLQMPDLFADMVRAWVTDSPLSPALKPIQ